MTQFYIYNYRTSENGFIITQLTSEIELGSVANSVVSYHAVTLRRFDLGKILERKTEASELDGLTEVVQWLIVNTGEAMTCID